MRYVKTNLRRWNEDVDSDSQQWYVQKQAYIPENLAKLHKSVTIDGNRWVVSGVLGRSVKAERIPKPFKPAVL